MGSIEEKLSLDRTAMRDRSTAHLRIYIGGLADQSSIEDIYEHFIQFGQINGIVVNKNFGFVQFEHEQSAMDAINKADGSVLQGKTLTVRTAVQTDKKREIEVVHIKPEIPPAVALTDSGAPMLVDDDDMYDNFGNYIGDGSAAYGEDEYEEGFSDSRRGRRGSGHRRRGGRGGPGSSGFPERDLPPAGPGPARGPPGPGPLRGPPGPVRGPAPNRFERYAPPVPDYPTRNLPVPEKNDCEIIVVAKSLTEYAEYIEGRLKRLGIVVDLLFPMEDVPIGKVLGNIASRGCLYAILVMPQNQEKRSLTLNILHGLPQEHRNMPIEDALQLLSRNFQEVQRGGPSGREAVYALLGQLADGRGLTVLQYDKVIEYLQERREQQVKLELGEPLASAPATKTQVDLQQRILSILNDKKVAEPAPPAPAQNKLLNDPTVRKALDSILSKMV